MAPGFAAILALSIVLLGAKPAVFVVGAAAGAGACVAAVAVHAAAGLVPASWQRAGHDRAARLRWLAYLLAGVLATVLFGAWVVAILLAAGLAELAWRRAAPLRAVPVLLPALASGGGLGALSWVALQVGALSYGGGFVIIPLMQADAVDRYHWLTATQFLYAVALGQITPGPVVLTVTAVGYAAAGLTGALLATVLAFLPSFLLVILGADHFDRLRENSGVQAFLTGAGPAAIGAIAGSALLLAAPINHLWQALVLLAAAVWLLVLRRGVVTTLLGGAATGMLAAAAGLPVG